VIAADFVSTTSIGGDVAPLAADAQLMAVLMLVLLAVTELPYLGFWYEVARGDRPTIILELFFWFVLVDGSFIGGAVGSTWGKYGR
jgi:hypothetical protein